MDVRPYDHAQTIDEIILALRQFMLVAIHIPDEDVARAQEVIQRAHGVGFVVDATAYHRALYNGTLERQEQIVRVFHDTKATLLKIFPKDAELLATLRASTEGRL